MTDYLEQLFLPPRALEKAASALEEVLLPGQESALGGQAETEAPRRGKAGADPEPEGAIPLEAAAAASDWTGTDGGAFRQEELPSLPLLRALTAADTAAAHSGGERGGEREVSGLSGGLSPSAKVPSIEVKTVDLAFQRDGRRYDNGFSLY